MKTIIVTRQQELEQVLAVRREVFVQEQGVDEELEVDEYDVSPDACVHFLLIEGDGTAIGAARMKPYEEGSVKMQRIAIRAVSRGHGYGRLLLQAMEHQAISDGYKYAVLDAQVQAQHFYSKQGYAIISEQPFYDAGIEHVRMRKKLFS